jgi:hypothetical protein
MSPKEQEPNPGGWAIAFLLDNTEVARASYENIRDSILTDDVDASVFRFTLDDRSYVALVGEGATPPDKREQAESLMADCGREATLPLEVLRQLLERRRAFKTTGLDYFERRS